jgi:hypothetical protein
MSLITSELCFEASLPAFETKEGVEEVFSSLTGKDIKCYHFLRDGNVSLFIVFHFDLGEVKNKIEPVYGIYIINKETYYSRHEELYFNNNKSKILTIYHQNIRTEIDKKMFQKIKKKDYYNGDDIGSYRYFIIYRENPEYVLNNNKELNFIKTNAENKAIVSTYKINERVYLLKLLNVTKSCTEKREVVDTVIKLYNDLNGPWHVPTCEDVKELCIRAENEESY